MQECSTTSGAAGSAGGQQPLLGLSSSCEKNERAAQGQQVSCVTAGQQSKWPQGPPQTRA